MKNVVSLIFSLTFILSLTTLSNAQGSLGPIAVDLTESTVPTLEKTVFPKTCDLKSSFTPALYRAISAASLDSCDTCSVETDFEIQYAINQGASACAAYSAGFNYCFTHCSPCMFCVRIGHLANYYCY